MGTTARTLTVVAASWLWLAPRAQAQPVTSDLIHFSSGQVDTVTLDDGARLSIGAVAWTARSGATPLDVTLTSRGLRSVQFFDPAPLLDAPFGESETAIRTALRLGPAEELPDHDAAGLPADVAALRERVRAHMRGFRQQTLAEVAGSLSCQRQTNVEDVAGALHGLLGCVAGLPHDGASAEALVRFLHARPLLTAVLQTSASGRAHVAGYLVRRSADDAAGVPDELYAAVAGARSEKVLTLSIATPPAFLASDGAKLFAGPAFTLLGIFVTAVVGFQVFKRQQAVQFQYFELQQGKQFEGFLRQQQYQEDRAAADRFQQRKFERFGDLTTFFRDQYSQFAKGTLTTPGDLRARLVEAQVYSIMPAGAAAALDRICTTVTDRHEALAQIDQLLRTQFGEFMRLK